MKLSPDDFEMSPLAAYGLIAIGLIIGVLGSRLGGTKQFFANTSARRP